MTDALKTYCRHCGQPFYSLALLAILQDCGASISPGPLTCVNGNQHEFIPPTESDKTRIEK